MALGLRMETGWTAEDRGQKYSWVLDELEDGRVDVFGLRDTHAPLLVRLVEEVWEQTVRWVRTAIVWQTQYLIPMGDYELYRAAMPWYDLGRHGTRTVWLLRT